MIAPEAEVIVRLAALAVILPEDAARLREALRLSNAEATRLAGAAEVATRLHGRAAPPLPEILRGLLLDFGRQAARDGLALAWAETRDGDAAPWASAARFLADTPEPHLPFSGADLIARGITPGPALGAALKRLQAAWIRAGFPQDPRVLAALMARVIGE